MSVITQIQEGAAVIHSLPYFRGGLDSTHGSTLFLLSLDVLRTCCPFEQAVRTGTQGTLVTVTGQLIPSSGCGCQEFQVCISWRAVAQFKQSNQDTSQLWKERDIIFMMDFIAKISAGHMAAFQGGQGSLLKSLAGKAAALHVSRAVLCAMMSSVRDISN